MDPQHQSHNLSPQTQRQGATPEDLPMMIYLRGDEDIVDSFCIGAEEAMDILGIKRSRLTQISGKELRVGRLRIGRYVRPVFRKEDIEAYKQWTRPTASHKASSYALEEAGIKVIDNIKDQLHTSNRDLIGKVEASSQRLRKNLKENSLKQDQLNNRILNEQTRAKQLLTSQISNLKKSLQAFDEKNTDTSSKIEKILFSIEALFLKLGGLSQAQESTKIEIQNLKSALEKDAAKKDLSLEEILDLSQKTSRMMPMPRKAFRISKRLQVTKFR